MSSIVSYLGLKSVIKKEELLIIVFFFSSAFFKVKVKLAFTTFSLLLTPKSSYTPPIISWIVLKEPIKSHAWSHDRNHMSFYKIKNCCTDFIILSTQNKKAYSKTK